MANSGWSCVLGLVEQAAAFTATECAEIVELARSAGFSPGRLVGGIGNGDIRTASISWLDEDRGAAWVLQRLASSAASMNRSHFGLDLSEFRERMQVASYEGSQNGHFGWHSDIGGGKLANFRKLTIVVQLSPGEAYSGGELEVNANGQPCAASREQGVLIAFPSFVLHRVKPVETGIRHSLTVWMHGPLFR
ncbi:MAG: 2OG-Fe(II) oxygenase [Rhizobiaceae bacterium]